MATLLPSTEIAALVEPDRVHRRVYADPAIFEAEMERIFGRTWVYVGHDSQIPNAGDFFRSRIGLHHVLVSRGRDEQIHVLINRCTHRGMRVCSAESGNAKRFTCPYHGWAFHTDGKLAGVPYPKSYQGKRDFSGDDFDLARAPSVETYRGFIFARLTDQGPDLKTYLGAIADALDNICDRAPDGEVELAGGRLKQEFRGNWKLHMENACDLVHPGIVHAAAADVARDHMDARDDGGNADQAVQMMQANGLSLEEWDGVNVFGYEQGHCYMQGFYRGGKIDPNRPDDPVFTEYMRRMYAAHGEEKTQKTLARETFNNLFYPNLSINTRYQQLRIIQPISVDTTHIYSHCFRLKGAPEEMFHASVKFVATANSPSSLVSADDFAIFEETQAGLEDPEVEWIDLARGYGDDAPADTGDGAMRAYGTSEMPMRTQLDAWRRYMMAA